MPQTTFLLDTNILLIALIAPQRLRQEWHDNLRHPENLVYFSAVSIWEIAIKRSLNKDQFDFDPHDIQHLAIETGFSELPIYSTHCIGVSHMPWHHRDPFDRLLIAQAQSLPAYLLTSDGQLAQYSDLVMQIALE